MFNVCLAFGYELELNLRSPWTREVIDRWDYDWQNVAAVKCVICLQPYAKRAIWAAVECGLDLLDCPSSGERGRPCPGSTCFRCHRHPADHDDDICRYARCVCGREEFCEDEEMNRLVCEHCNFKICRTCSKGVFQCACHYKEDEQIGGPWAYSRRVVKVLTEWLSGESDTRPPEIEVGGGDDGERESTISEEP